MEGDDWNNVGSYQLVPGEVKDFHKRKSLEAQCLERIQQRLDDQFQQVAKEFGLPEDLLQNRGKKQKAVEENNITTLDKHYQGEKRHETQSPNSKNNNGEGGTMVQLDNKAVEENTTKHQENNTSDEDSNDESKESTDESENSVNTEQINFKRMIDRCTVERRESKRQHRTVKKTSNRGEQRQRMDQRRKKSQ